MSQHSLVQQPNSDPSEDGSNCSQRDWITALLVGIMCCAATALLAFFTSSQYEKYIAGEDPSFFQRHSTPSTFLSAVICFLINWVAFIPSAIFKTERYYDLVGAATFLSVVAAAFGIIFSANELVVSPWRVLPAVLVAIWAIRLGVFLGYRVHHNPRGDVRFDKMKQNPVRFFVPWTVQALWAFVTSLSAVVQLGAPHAPSYILGDSTASSSYSVICDCSSILGLILWAAGFTLEAVADAQKMEFASYPQNRGRFISRGVWSWCRHPNYFGEIVLWLGMFLLGVRAYRGAQWLAVLSPITVAVLLLFVSGVPILERNADRKWGHEEEYQSYKRTVHVMLPFVSQCSGS